MIINVDVKSLEIYGACWLSGDKTLTTELLNDVDVHKMNQTDVGLPSREDAKRFVFRILYGGTEYGFCKDSKFTHISTSKVFWKRVIDKFYAKYDGLYEWHNSLLRQVGKTGKIITPFGRCFTYTRDSRGELPAQAIKNYIVNFSDF